MIKGTDQAELLNRAAADADKGCEQIALGYFAVVNGDPEKAKDLLRDAQDTVQAVMRRLAEAGAGPVPAWRKLGPQTPLELLDTPKSRALLEALRNIVPIAEAVDAERGHVIPDEIPLGPGESRGTGWAETLSTLVLQLSLDVEGPKGRD
ncbi:MAG: hypothetical protein V4671_08045 [Armatimonadota bacterium]